MKIERVVVGPLEANCWIVEGSDGGVTVIDPGDETNAINEAIGNRLVHAVILTHGHFDHMGAADEVTDDNNSFLWAHAAEVKALNGKLGRGGEIFGVITPKPKIDCTVAHGDVIEAGDLRFEVIHTPGHTPGSMCLLVRDGDSGEQHLFTGDMLFAGSIGRTDLPGSMPEVMEDSLELLADSLDPSVKVYPGHGTTSTIARESAVNPYWPS